MAAKSWYQGFCKLCSFPMLLVLVKFGTVRLLHQGLCSLELGSYSMTTPHQCWVRLLSKSISARRMTRQTDLFSSTSFSAMALLDPIMTLLSAVLLRHLFSSLEDLNHAFVAKLVWRFLYEGNSLWQTLSRPNILEVTLLDHSCTCKMLQYSEGSDHCKRQNGAWCLLYTRSRFSNKISIISSMYISTEDVTDKLLWLLHPDGLFSVKSYQKSLQQQRSSSSHSHNSDSPGVSSG